MINRMVMMIGGLLVMISLPLLSSQAAPAHSMGDPSTFLVPGHPMAEQQTVTVEFGGALGTVYNPAEVRISPGDSIQWLGDFAMHPLVSDDGLFPTVSSGTEFIYTFTQPGDYPYHCQVHSSLGMRGTVTVGYFGYLPLIIQ